MKACDLLDLRPLPSVYLLKDQCRRPEVSKVYDLLDKGFFEKASEAAKALEEDLSLLVLSDVHRLWGDFWGAADLVEEAVEASRPDPSSSLLKAAALVALQRAKMRQGAGGQDALKEVQQLCGEILDLVNAEDQVSAEGFGHVIAAETAIALQRYSEAMQAAKVAVHCFRSRDAVAQASALLLLSCACSGAACFREAVAAANVAAVTARSSGQVLLEALAKRQSAQMLLMLGEEQQAAVVAEDSVSLFNSLGDSTRQLDSLLLCAEAQLRRVKRREANAQRSSLRAWALKAKSLAHGALGALGHGEAPRQALLLRARAAKAAGELAQALEDATEAQKLLSDASDRCGVASCLLLQAEVKAVEGQESEALTLRTQAQAMLKSPTQADTSSVEMPRAAASLEGLVEMQWEDHIHFCFRGLQGRPVSNVVKGS